MWFLEEVKAVGFIVIGVVCLFGAMLISDMFTTAGDKMFKKKSNDESR